MKGYIQSLHAAADAANRERKVAQAKRLGTDPRVLSAKPLRQQIEELMRSLSPAQRNRPWSMDELVTRLEGRYRARPHPMNVGQALTALGWASVRDWTRDGGGKRYWALKIKIDA